MDERETVSELVEDKLTDGVSEGVGLALLSLVVVVDSDEVVVGVRLPEGVPLGVSLAVAENVGVWLLVSDVLPVVEMDDEAVGLLVTVFVGDAVAVLVGVTLFVADVVEEAEGDRVDVELGVTVGVRVLLGVTVGDGDFVRVPDDEVVRVLDAEVVRVLDAEVVRVGEEVREREALVVTEGVTERVLEEEGQTEPAKQRQSKLQKAGAVVQLNRLLAKRIWVSPTFRDTFFPKDLGRVPHRELFLKSLKQE